MNPFFRFFSSLRLTVVLLAFCLALVFFGTLAQTHWGVHETQKRYFESLIVFWQYPLEWPMGAQWRWIHVPLPGGFLLGGFLVLNLVCAHFRYFKASWGRIGIVMIHGGVVLLVISGFLIAFLQQESQLFLDEGGPPVNYSIDFRESELVIIDRSQVAKARVTRIPESLLHEGESFILPELPFSLQVEFFARNAGVGLQQNLLQHYEGLLKNPTLPSKQRQTIATSIEHLSEGEALVLGETGMTLLTQGELPLQGFAKRMHGVIQEQPLTFESDKTNLPAAVVTVIGEAGPLGTWIVSSAFDEAIPVQAFNEGGKMYEIAMRFRRHDYPFWMQLQQFSHDKYPGTEIPMNFSSDLILINPETGDNRRVLIYMNHPLRYAGLTFFQQSFANDDTTSILMVVRNPAWRLPYLAVALVGFGMLVHFTIKLVRFTRMRGMSSGDC